MWCTLFTYICTAKTTQGNNSVRNYVVIMDRLSIFVTLRGCLTSAIGIITKTRLVWVLRWETNFFVTDQMKKGKKLII